MICLWFL